jgi:hypothetical protein
VIGTFLHLVPAKSAAAFRIQLMRKKILKFFDNFANLMPQVQLLDADDAQTTEVFRVLA